MKKPIICQPVAAVETKIFERASNRQSHILKDFVLQSARVAEAKALHRKKWSRSPSWAMLRYHMHIRRETVFGCTLSFL
jgi:hypothetical protein